ncbi:MAG: thioredoxin [Erysipelotrichaceae bacterium]|jgi:thioredoxin 1|uniref:Thioredoxin n=1 Tax=Grylomicrobium aquisgranensis TaxID=2926318 RepID=A0AB35U2W5_9FIRM|nr:thioredoxin [Lactimicrobium massiliense]MCH4019610.1 thioredoxin [Erysipelotrichaceae bacterium]MDX8419825.1 thioredoxin [Stecheria sp. CLA-KB-P133]MCH4045397.1 thioredoxin [Erysipelotrichaceae bacterium]MCH4122607.1 thioredoxin [Erysipelotrichaceae bacterium]MDD6230452.1 thioredoxin [Lactimicrobium massiliense]
MNIIKNTAEYDETLKNNKSVFVDFYADWCGPCKMLGPVVEQLAGENSDVTFIKVNVDDNPEVAERYGIMSIPTLIAFKNGEVAGSSVGFQPKEAVQELINKAK